MSQEIEYMNKPIMGNEVKAIRVTSKKNLGQTWEAEAGEMPLSLKSEIFSVFKSNVAYIGRPCLKIIKIKKKYP